MNLASALERKTKTLIVNGLWLEDEAMAADADFALALAQGLAHFARFHEAEQLDLSAVQPALLRDYLKATATNLLAD